MAKEFFLGQKGGFDSMTAQGNGAGLLRKVVGPTAPVVDPTIANVAPPVVAPPAGPNIPNVVAHLAAPVMAPPALANIANPAAPVVALPTGPNIVANLGT